MHDDLRLLSHVAAWCALVASLAAILPPVDAYGIDDLGYDQVRAAPVVRLREPVRLPVSAPSPAAEQAVAASGGRAARREARQAARPDASPSRIHNRLLGTRGESRSALVERLWEGGEGTDVSDALDAATATGDAVRGPRSAGTGDAGPADGGALGRIGTGAARIAVEASPVVAVPAKVSIGTPQSSDPERAAAMSLAPYAGALRYCYEKRLMVVPDLEGRVELSLGRDRAPRLVVDTIGDAELGRCLLSAARRWDLPEGLDEVALPVVFTTPN